MSLNWKRSISQTSSSVQLGDIARYLTRDPVQSPRPSPIDRFYEDTRSLLRAAHPDLISAHPSMGALFLVGFVSATENYFRDVLARVIRVCPIAQSASADERIQLGSVVWHGGLDAERGAFEHMSFAAAKNIKETVHKYMGYQIKKNQDVDAILAEFDRVCELRHGIVHSGSVLAGKNAIKLRVSRTDVPLKIGLGFAEVQSCGAICTNLIVATNAELFEEMAGRWAKQWRLDQSWHDALAEDLFGEVWSIFYSVTDKLSGQIPVTLDKEACMTAVFAALG